MAVARSDPRSGSGVSYRPVAQSDGPVSRQKLRCPPAPVACVGLVMLGLVLGIVTGVADFRLQTRVFLCSFAGSPLAARAKPVTEIIAHRGSEWPYPENSLEALKFGASRLGSVEFDVALSEDEEVVLMHDDTLDRTTNGTGRVCDLTLDELQSLRLSKPAVVPKSYNLPLPSCEKESSVDGVCLFRVPTLREVFAGLPRDVQYMIDLKVCDTSPSAACNQCEKLADGVKKLIEENGLDYSRIVFTSTDYPALDSFAEKMPNASFALSVDHHYSAMTAARFVKLLDSHNYDAVAFYVGLAGWRPDLVRAVRTSTATRAGRQRRVFAWTVRQSFHARVAVCSGIDRLIVAYPGHWMKPKKE